MYFESEHSTTMKRIDYAQARASRPIKVMLIERSLRTAYFTEDQVNYQ